uniref:Uncharacterized protein n=1 Tax=Babesia sp. Dunhuang TaxID=1164853 RepID=A0A411AD79_9APIC|nr:hypothetical protein BXAP_12 [Babesia sp. Xinjiang]QAX26975.1 hypothetical protein [Babesia sp. Xinjiang]QAX27006.1 hypothetical protein [Babesia sp. Dunhuang]
MKNLFISNNVILKYHNLLYISLTNIYGIHKYRSNIILSLISLSKYKIYNNISCSTYVYFNKIFNYITFNINIFKKKSELYNKRKYLQLFKYKEKKNENKNIRKKIV